MFTLANAKSPKSAKKLDFTKCSFGFATYTPHLAQFPSEEKQSKQLLSNCKFNTQLLEAILSNRFL